MPSAPAARLPVRSAALMSITLVAQFVHATSSMVSKPSSTPVLLIAKGSGRMELGRGRRGPGVEWG